MGCHVVDTCVLIAANGMADASPVCADACRAALLQALNEMVALDDQWLILNEYFTYAHHSGQPGLGDAFAKRLRDQQFDPKVVDAFLKIAKKFKAKKYLQSAKQ